MSNNSDKNKKHDSIKPDMSADRGNNGPLIEKPVMDEGISIVNE